MNEKEALRWLDSLVSTHNDSVRDGIAAAATRLGLGWHTVYGWYRRRSVPDWRLRDIQAAAAPSRKASAK